MSTKAPRARLTVEQIDAATDRSDIELSVPEWNGAVLVRGLSHDQMALARQQAWDKQKSETNEDYLNAWCLALGMVDPEINFAIAKRWIEERSFGSVNTILAEILNATGIGRRAVDAAKSTDKSGPAIAE